LEKGQGLGKGVGGGERGVWGGGSVCPSGKHPHLSTVILCLLLVDILLVYGSGAGVFFSWQ